MLHRVFRSEVVKALVSETSYQPVLVRGPVNPRDMERLTGRHFLSKIPLKKVRSRHVLCALAKLEKKTPGDGCKTARSTYECKTCDVELFVDPCFEVYYTKKDYKQAYQ